MDYEKFKLSAKSALREYFGEKVSVSLQQITKNNNTQLDGLMIEDGSVNITPTIFLNYHYEDYLAGKPFSSVLDDIIASYRENLPSQSMDLSFFTDYQKVKHQIIYKVINYAQNEEQLKDLPHFRYLDLAVVFCCFMPDPKNGNATILIHNHHLSLWGVTADALHELAQKNTPLLLPHDLSNLEDVLKFACTEHCLPDDMADRPNLQNLLGETSADNEIPPLYILSNAERYYGASVLLYPRLLSCIGRLLDSDLYILPSSVHEILLLPKSSCPHTKGLNCIIQEVNGQHVSREEILSDHFYYYDRKTDTLTL